MTDITKLGKYEILEDLGRGGFGVVYKARDTVLDRVVAVKVLHPNLVNDLSFVSRFRNEARLAAQLDHPNIVPVHDFGESEGLYYIVMGHMPGGSLKELLQKEGALPEEKALAILRQVSDGLSYAHRKGIIHRDLKPGNILFDEEGEARVSDLGFAKLLHSDSSSSLTMSGGVVGTPAYMAPEIWKGLPATPAVDVYSSACIFVEMLTGKPLFDGDSTPVIMLKHFQPVSLPENLPENWKPAILKALSQEPEDRYQDLASFVADLDATTARAEVAKETPLRDRLQTLLGHREAPTMKKKVAEDDSHQAEASREAPDERAPIIEEDGQVPESATRQIAQTADEKRIEELQALPEKKDDRKWMLFASLGILAISLIVLSFSLLKGRNRYAPVPVASETPSLPPTHTPTKLPSKTPTKTPTSKPTRTPDPNLGIGSMMTRETDGMEMVYVPAGKFIMGSENGYDDQKPVRQVYLDSYWIDKYEVSNAQYALCVASGACTKPSLTKSQTRNNYYGNPDYDNYPVIQIDWHQSQAYCQWVGGDLPTEAQWEKAARGTDGRTYPWGNESPTCQLTNFNKGLYGNQSYCIGDTSPVTDYEQGASPYGALNMAGNVWEWVNDWYGSNYYSNSSTRNPAGPTSGRYRVIRGGSWDYYYNGTWGIRAADRYGVNPTNTVSGDGFRCVLPQP